MVASRATSGEQGSRRRAHLRMITDDHGFFFLFGYTSLLLDGLAVAVGLLGGVHVWRGRGRADIEEGRSAETPCTRRFYPPSVSFDRLSSGF